MRRILAGLGLLLIGGIVGFAIGWLTGDGAPELSTVELQSCVTDAGGECLVMPAVSGNNLDGVTVSYPEAFTGELNLVVMPFDRDQQVGAAQWVPLFQELAGNADNLDYASIAALPDLNPAIRALVVGGMSAAVARQEVRDRTVILFLEDQTTFLDALDVPDDEQMWVFILNGSGEVLYQQAGNFSDANAAAFREALAGLQGG